MGRVYYFDSPGQDGDFIRWRFEAGHLWKGEEEVPISPTLAGVLLVLLAKKNKVATFKEFYERVWEGKVRDRNNVSRAVTQLEKDVFRSHETGKEFIENVRGKGYRFVWHVEGDPDEPVASAACSDSPITLGEGRPYRLLTHRSHAFDSGGFKRDEWVRTASEIDLLGKTLYTAWLGRPPFVKDLLDRLLNEKDGLTLRVLLPSPDSNFFRQFIDDYLCGWKQEHAEPGENFLDTQQALEQAAELRRKVEGSIGKARYLLRKCQEQLTKQPPDPFALLLHEHMIPCGIVRFDNVMKIGTHRYPYQTGEEATLLLEKRKPRPNDSTDVKADIQIASELFDQYLLTINRLWEQARKHPKNQEFIPAIRGTHILGRGLAT